VKMCSCHVGKLVVPMGRSEYEVAVADVVWCIIAEVEAKAKAEASKSTKKVEEKVQVDSQCFKTHVFLIQGTTAQAPQN
jgi:hypothetical protein